MAILKPSNIFFAFVLLAFTPALAFADDTALNLAGINQPAEPSKPLLPGPWWFDLGLGVGAIAQSKGTLAGDVSANYAFTPNQFLSVRAVGINNTGGISASNLGLALTGGMLRANNMIGGVGDIGPMYGIRTIKDWGYMGVSTGLAMADGRINATTPGGAGNGFTTIGIPFQAEAFYDVNSHLGLGLIGFADVNTKASFMGITLAVQMGDLMTG